MATPGKVGDWLQWLHYQCRQEENLLLPGQLVYFYFIYFRDCSVLELQDLQPASLLLVNGWSFATSPAHITTHPHMLGRRVGLVLMGEGGNFL